MKRYNNIFIAITVTLLSLVSCDTVDFGDINDNNNGPSELNTAGLLTAAQRRISTFAGRPYLGNPNLYVQYRAQPVYQTPSQYADTPVNWSAYYVQTMQNLQQVINIANDPSLNTQLTFTNNGSKENQIGVARIFKAMIFKRVTDTYGDIPYAEGLNPDIITPAYTPQAEIYEDLIKELQEARDMLDPAGTAVAGDVFYGGNVANWKKFANSLLLSIAVQLSEANPTLGAATANEALSDPNGVIETVADEAWYRAINLGTLANPWTQFRPADYNLSEYFQDALQGDAADFSNSNFDKRLNIFSTNPTAQGLPYGLADYTGIGSNAQISLYLTSADSPVPFMTAAYTYLNRAEAAQKYGTGEVALTMLQTGIERSFESISENWGSVISPAIDITADGPTHALARVADAGVEGIDRVIGEEKWIALFTQGFDAWSEWRRSDFPILTPSPDPLNDGNIPTRYSYPSTEISSNNSNYNQGVSGLTPAEDKNTAKVWWDQ